MTLGGVLWADLDNDGLKDSREPSISGATLFLLKADGTPAVDMDGDEVTPIVSAADGRYAFNNLPEGDYIVQMVSPAGYKPTVASSDPNNDQSSDSNGLLSGENTVTSNVITLTWGEEPDDDGDNDPASNLTLDFGFVTATADEALQIPTASTWTLGILSMMLSMMAFWHRRRFKIEL